MKLTFYGAARTVTGSKHLVELDGGHRLLLDCGLFQGRRAEADHLNRHFPFDPAALDAVLLSHAHIDHAGLLPKLWKEGFRGRIYATHATYSLCSLMLLDSAYIQEKDAAFVNKLHRKKGKPPVEPLYRVEEAEAVLEHFTGVSYRSPFVPVPGVEVEYRDAGHILGSATMVLTIRENGRTVRLGFTGDVGNPGRPILRDPQPMADCDVLISESTYGGEVHEPGARTKERLAEVITRTSGRGGKVIIPAFAVGRTQEIVYALDQLWNEGRLPPIPVYVDSPLAVNATGIYAAHPECYDRDLRQYLLEDDDPFGFERLTYVRDVEKSKALNGQQVPMVIISASGMCEAGRILHHLRHNIEDPRNTVMIVGYCADHTLGKRIVERRPEVRIFGEPHALRAEVVVMNSLSAHADEPGLLDFIGRLDRDRLRRIFLVHGAPERQEAFKQALEARGYRDVVIPEYRESFEL
ncbi:MBL fold metallo-hydrolase [Rhodocaloribacter litoris]|uniref:MBL fold metallo-hydrolase RNA specificity domain-containing protein n=1 Tax=Rhodocaloribacter litoris TaxID=2558931 RepID=UPI001421671F|nr:MBL fold metallo-hydrolase [Rhodocaloribacter litoris]QXD17071.1 MBL fold metallo-hydrolase [Rhodocaloribacter litoris]